MTLYRCWLRDREGAPLGWKPIQSDTDAGARQLALNLLRDQPEVRNLEAWRNADLAFRLTRWHLDAH
jgi:hypothetical protein